MKEKRFKRICAFVLAMVMLVSVLPASLLPVKAASMKWEHLSEGEENTGTASYDAASDTITFINDYSWSGRMKYNEIGDVTGKDYVVEFDTEGTSGMLGVYSVEDSGNIYGVYLDTATAVLDELQIQGWVNVVDNFAFAETEKHPTVSALNWTATDNTKSHLRVEFICGEGGTLAGGTVNYYKKDSATGEYLNMGSISVPTTIVDDANLANKFGVQMYCGGGKISNITVKELSTQWEHMSQEEQASGGASYDILTDTITFNPELFSWAGRMKHSGIDDVSGKDYAIEFDVTNISGLIGVYNFEDSGNLYGVYLDATAMYLDALYTTDWATIQDNFEFLAAGSGKTPINNWTVADNTSAHLRVEFIRGAGGTLAGGTVNYYKKDSGTAKYQLMGSVAISDTVTDDAKLANKFGIQIFCGSGTVSNITIQELNWVHMSQEERDANTALYDFVNDKITFTVDGGWSSRMQYRGLSDVTGKDYAIEFDLNATSGVIGVYNYEAISGTMYGAYLDLAATKIDTVYYKAGGTCEDDFHYRETITEGATVHDQVPCEIWPEDIATSRIRAVFCCGNKGTLAGGSVNYYKLDESTGTYIKLGRVEIPGDIEDRSEYANYFGIQLWLGEGTVSNITISEYEKTLLAVGGDETKTTSIHVPVIDGDILPTGSCLKGKYIVGWTVDGTQQLTYEDDIPKDKYVADFIDTKMLEVKLQDSSVTAGTNATTLDARFIASVNDLKRYKTAGLVFSLSNAMPEDGGEKCITSSTTKVNESINVKYSTGQGNTSISAKELYDDYSTNMFTCEIIGVPVQQPAIKIYVRAYVELEDGRKVYGDTRYVAIPGEGIDMIEGATAPITLSDGGWSITSDEYSLEVYETSRGYETQIKDLKNVVVAEQVNPIDIQIKNTDNTITTLAANYDVVKAKGNTIVATARVESPAGSVFVVTDQYVGLKTGGFELARDVQVQKALPTDQGFNSIVRYKERDALKNDAYEYFMPGVIQRNSNNLLSGAPGSNMSLDYVWVRDTMMPMPMIMTRNKKSGFSFSMGRVVEDKITSGVDESDHGWLVNKDINYGSCGISNVDGYVSMDVCYPGMEGDWTFLDWQQSFLRRSHPISADVKHSYKVVFCAKQQDDFSAAMVDAYQLQFEENPTPEIETDLTKVYDQTLDLLEAKTGTHNNSKYGMPGTLKLNGAVESTDYLIGFTGQQTSVGFQLIRDGIKTSDSSERAKGRKVIDFWVNNSFTDHGFPKIWYTNGQWADQSFVTCYLRCMSDGMEGILDAYLEEKAAGTTYDTWLNRCVQYADWLVEVQNEDGSYYRAYDPDTGLVSQKEGAADGVGKDGKIAKDKNNTSCAIRYLVRMYELTAEQKYLNAAISAGQYVYDNSYLQGTYYGGTPDGENAVDREAAIIALYAFNSLYEGTKDKKWLEAAEHAAICSASYVYTYDFTVKGTSSVATNQRGEFAESNIYQTVGTSGISRISTSHLGVDSFAAYLYYEYFKLYITTQNQFYYDFAKLLQNNTKQFVSVDGSLAQYGYENGIVNEAQNISFMYYYHDVEACLPWCNIAMVTPIASMEDTFGVKTIEEAEQIDRNTLLEMLEAYGAGGKKK